MMILRQLLTIAFVLPLAGVTAAQGQATSTISMDMENHPRWRSEFEYPHKSRLCTDGKTITIESFGGATLWLDSLLTGDYIIEYERMVLLDSGKYDRLSDLNQFWLASEADGVGTLHVKDGKLSSYDTLDLFYVGMGGNNNSTTRFRHYDGTGDRVLLDEKNEQTYLLKPNVYYTIKTVVSLANGFTAFYVNDELLFSYQGALRHAGFFGFRQTAARQKIRNLKIYKLDSLHVQQ